jgi:signal transduction histidine kinase
VSGVRRQLATLVAVTMTLVLVAFLVPLGIVLRGSAADRAISLAIDTAQATAALIAADPGATVGIEGTPASGVNISVFLADGSVAGAPAARTPSVQLAARANMAFTTTSGGGVESLVPVQGMPGGTAVVRAYAPPHLMNQGVTRTWLVLGVLGLLLFVLGLLLADQLGRRLRGAVTGLAATADRLAGGDLSARAEPDGPRELRRVGAELNRLAARIGELLTAEREEVADLAHRLRTPVTALRLDAEAVADPEDRQRFTADVDHLERIVDEVIRTARRPEREGVGAASDLTAVAAARVAFWTPLAEDDGRPITSDLPRHAVVVRCAEADLGAAIDALIQNVFAHTPDGTATHVTVSAGPAGGGVLTVADEGPGFSADADLSRGAGSGTSTGLGLDIARRTAESSGGTMTLRNASPAGAVITLTFAAPA